MSFFSEVKKAEILFEVIKKDNKNKNEFQNNWHKLIQNSSTSNPLITTVNLSVLCSTHMVIKINYLFNNTEF